MKIMKKPRVDETPPQRIAICYTCGLVFEVETQEEFERMHDAIPRLQFGNISERAVLCPTAGCGTPVIAWRKGSKEAAHILQEYCGCKTTIGGMKPSQTTVMNFIQGSVALASPGDHQRKDKGNDGSQKAANQTPQVQFQTQEQASRVPPTGAQEASSSPLGP